MFKTIWLLLSKYWLQTFLVLALSCWFYILVDSYDSKRHGNSLYYLFYEHIIQPINCIKKEGKPKLQIPRFTLGDLKTLGKYGLIYASIFLGFRGFIYAFAYVVKFFKMVF